MQELKACEKTEHDQIVAARVDRFWFLYHVLSDPDIIRNKYFFLFNPDIVVLDEKYNIIYIEKVETESTVTESEKNRCWFRYSKFGYSFNLIVPISHVSKARELVIDLPINKLYYYQFTPMGVRFRQINKWGV